MRVDREKLLEFLVFVGMALFYAAFLYFGQRETVEVTVEHAPPGETFEQLIKSPALVGGGVLVILALLFSGKMRNIGAKRQLLLAAMASALLAVWQLLNHRYFSLFAVGGAVVVALSLILLARNRKDPED